MGILFLGAARAAEDDGSPTPRVIAPPLMPPLPGSDDSSTTPPLPPPAEPVPASAAPVVQKPSSASAPARHSTLDPHVTVTKIHEVRNDSTRIHRNEDDFHPMRNDALEFEKEYWNYGAVTKEQRNAKRGQIYVISWRNGAPASDFVVRFEYRQQNSHDLVKVKTLSYRGAKGNVRSIFQVIGDEYHKDGPVEGWCLSILRNGLVVGQEKSFVW
ncbi:MAG: hypothetical protein PW734_06055 [Verrucomicrobium sp.]|nr:hypothetical protein [Verrucomicrobium sp.]